MNKNNLRIRTALTENKVYQWQLAKRLGISEPTLTRMLREELPDDEQDRLVSIIRGGDSNDN